MIEYIKNILPRLKAASQKVNQKEQLVDKTWVWVGFAEEFSTIHFFRDQRLLVIIQYVNSLKYNLFVY